MGTERIIGINEKILQEKILMPDNWIVHVCNTFSQIVSIIFLPQVNSYLSVALLKEPYR